MKTHTSLLLISCLSFMFVSISDVACQERTIHIDIPVPPGYTRVEYQIGGFTHWIQHLPLKKSTDIIGYRNIIISSNDLNVWAVVDMPLMFVNQDLEQCADYCMRFWSEYHRANNLLDRLFLFDYNGNKKMFRDSGYSFRKFLKQAFAYSNSHSLKKGCVKIQPDELRPGDMLVQNKTGGVGHVSMILGVCTNKNSDKLYLVGYSYMPAQEFHIVKANDFDGVAGWFKLEGVNHHLIGFGPMVYRRFQPYTE